MMVYSDQKKRTRDVYKGKRMEKNLTIREISYPRKCEDIVQIFDNYGLDTEIIAASVRNPIHVTDCALAGAHIATVPYAVIEQMTKHPLTDQGIEKFQKDYKAVFGE